MLKFVCLVLYCYIWSIYCIWILL